MEVKLHDGLSEEAALTRIEALQNAAARGPLYVHSSVRDRQRRPQSGYGRAPSEAAQPGSSAGLLGASYGLTIPAHSIPFGAAGDADSTLQLPGAGSMPVLEFLQIISKNLDLPFPHSSSSNGGGGGGGGGGDGVTERDANNTSAEAIKTAPTLSSSSTSSTSSSTSSSSTVHLDSDDYTNRGRSWRVVPNTLDGTKPRPLQMSAATQLGVIPCPGTLY